MPPPAPNAWIARLWGPLLAGMLLLAAALVAYPISHLATPVSFNYSEGWNAYHQQEARLGQPLYAAPPGLTIANYPPVSFHLVAWLAPLFGAPLFSVVLAGRLLALASLVAAAINVGLAAATGATARQGAFAALCLLLWVALLTPGRIATDDPSFLGLALATGGLCLYRRSRDRALPLVAAAALFALAVFVKDNLLAFPLATVLHLLLTRRFRAVALVAAAGILTAALLLALTLAADGPFFFAHLLTPRTLSRADALASIARFTSLFGAPLVVAIVWLLRAAPRDAAYPALCLACAALLAAGFSFGNGVAYNVYYETLAALAWAAAAALGAVERAITPRRRGVVPLAIVALAILGPVLLHAPAELYGALGRAGRLPRLQADYAAGVARLRDTPGPALCESLLMCAQAGKPFRLDPYFVKDQLGIGRLPEARLLADLDAHRFAAIEIGEDDPAFTLAPGPRLRFTAATVDGLLAHYQPVLTTPTFAILVPR